MASINDLQQAVHGFFQNRWDDTRRTTTVPSVDDLVLSGNHGIRLDACVLYADMSDSTHLVDQYSDTFAAGIYKAYMHCAGKLIKDAGGEITAYDGDRVMAIFMGPDKESAATKAALHLSYALEFIIWPTLAADYLYPLNSYRPWHTVGIDSSELLSARIGVRGGNDIVWVGPAANHAAKLCADKLTGTIRISETVWGRLRDPFRYQRGQNIWISEGIAPSGVMARSTGWWYAPWFCP